MLQIRCYFDLTVFGLIVYHYVNGENIPKSKIKIKGIIRVIMFKLTLSDLYTKLCLAKIQRTMLILPQKYGSNSALLKNFWRTWVLFVGPIIPLFWTSGDVSSGFQSQSWQPYLSLVEAYVLHSRLVWHLLTSWRPVWQVSHLFHIPARHWWDSKLGAIMPPLTVWDQAGDTLYRLSYPGSAEFSPFNLLIWPRISNCTKAFLGNWTKEFRSLF